MNQSQPKDRVKGVWPTLLVALSLVVAACGSTEPAETTAAPSDSETTATTAATGDTTAPETTSPDAPDDGAEQMVLRAGMGSDAQSLDPPNFVLAGDFTRMDLIFDRLVDFDQDGNLIPGLATDWTQIDDTTWEFNLREGVQFHDGTGFNAEAVKAVIDRSKVQDQGVGFLGMIETVEVVDDFTVRFLLDRPFASLLNNLTVPVAGIYSPASVEQYGDDVARNPVGTGPYEFVEWQPDQILVLEKNENYWGDLPPVDRVEFIPIPEAGTRLSALQSGDVHVIENPPPDQVSLLRDDPDLQAVIEPKARPVFLGFNLEEVTDLRVRQAIAQAIDKELIVEAVLEGIGQPATTSWVPPQFAETDPPVTYEYDPDAARALIEEAGAEGTELRLVLPQERYLKDQAIAEVIQAQLAEIGIALNLDIRETGAWYTALLDRDTELYWLGWGMSSGDPADMFTRVIYSDVVNNMSQFSDPEVDGWIDELQAIPPGSPEREELFWQIQNRVVNEEVALVPIYHMSNYFGARACVNEFHTTTSELFDISETTVDC